MHGRPDKYPQLTGKYEVTQLKILTSANDAGRPLLRGVLGNDSMNVVLKKVSD